MSTITQCFQPPLYWQQFEDLTEGVFRSVYGDPRPTKFGRPGQSQNGVDIFGNDSDGRLIGIQCKRMDELDENNQPRPGGKVLVKHLLHEINEASKFSPQLDTWILATTAKRDANIQRNVLNLSQNSRTAGSFGIQVWFWDDFVTDLNRNHDLQRWYYDNVIKIHSDSDQDKIILELFAEAFSRAAFRTPLYQETPSEFIQALKDTQYAINTGELKDRETRRVIRKTIGSRRALACETCFDYLHAADSKLQELRIVFQEGLNNGLIHQSGGHLQIPKKLQFELNTLRDAAVASVNDALKHEGIRLI